MANTNYFSGIVKILENPNATLINNQLLITKVRAELSQKRKTTLVYLIIFGKLGQDVTKFYKLNDYILVEGYTSIHLRVFSPSKLNTINKVFINVSRVYPILLDTNNLF